MANDGDESDLLGRNIKRFRGEMGVTMQEFSQLLGVSLPTVYRWEQGRMRVSAHHLRKLAEVTGRRLDDFFMADPPPAPRAPTAQVRFKIIGEMDDDLKREIASFIDKINYAQIDRVQRKLREGRKGKKL